MLAYRRIITEGTGDYIGVPRMAKLLLSVDDVLGGKVDLDSLEAIDVGIYHLVSGQGFTEKLLEAVNDMAKFGWRLRCCIAGECTMESAQ